MKEVSLTKQQLLDELNKLKRKVKRIEKSEADLKETEYALQRSESLYSALFDNNPIQTVVVDHRGCVIAYNTQKRISGDRLPAVGDVMYKDYASRHNNDMYSELLHCIQSGEIREYPEQKYMDKFLNITIAPIEKGAIITSIDVTEKKKAEQELLKIRKAVENTSEAIGLFDSRGINYYQNKAFNDLFGYSTEELASLGGVPPFYKDQKLAADIFKTVMKGKSWKGEVDVVSKNQRKFIVRILADAIKDDNGEIIGLVCVHTDITEQKRFEEESRDLQAQVLHAQKLESLGVLAGSIAHDFNNLLLGILGNADLALLELQPGSQTKQYISDINLIAKRAAELCKQMLAYSGKGKFLIEALNISRLVEDIGNLLEISISKNAELKYNLKEDISFFKADATQVRQVIMNLVTNASDAIGESGGTITVSTGTMKCDRNFLKDAYGKENLPEGEYVFLEVADTGCGMDEATLENIFDPFFSTKVSGRGLGLAAVLGIIRSHGGACKVASSAGKGTTFKVLFPVSENFQTEHMHDDRLKENGVAYRKVLLIDNDEAAISTAVNLLEEIGFGVITARDNEQALEQLNKHLHEIKLIILDTGKRGINERKSINLFKEIKKDIPLILSTVSEKSIKTRKLKNNYIAGFIYKPFQSEELRKIILETFSYKT